MTLAATLILIGAALVIAALGAWLTTARSPHARGACATCLAPLPSDVVLLRAVTHVTPEAEWEDVTRLPSTSPNVTTWRLCVPCWQRINALKP